VDASPGRDLIFINFEESEDPGKGGAARQETKTIITGVGQKAWSRNFDNRRDVIDVGEATGAWARETKSTGAEPLIKTCDGILVCRLSYKG